MHRRVDDLQSGDATGLLEVKTEADFGIPCPPSERIPSDLSYRPPQSFLEQSFDPVPSDSQLQFVVHAPGYSVESAGNRALHVLASELAKRGHRVRVRWGNPWGYGVPAEQEWVHIYPEIITGNPAEVERVVRWTLLPPGFATKQPMGESPSDLIFTWVPHFFPQAPRLMVDIFGDDFPPKDKPGQGQVYYVGKGINAGDHDFSAVRIDREIPFANREELAQLLRSADLLVSYDWNSALNYEATLSGTPVVVIAEHRVEETIFGTAGMANGWKELDWARLTVNQAQANWAAAKEVIREDVDRMILSTKEHWGL